MSSVNNVGPNAAAQNIQKVYTRPIGKSANPDAAQAPKATRGADKLELSGVGQMLKTLKAGGDVRADKVAAIKAQIAAGTYEADHKLDAATDRLLDDLLK